MATRELQVIVDVGDATEAHHYPIDSIWDTPGSGSQWIWIRHPSSNEGESHVLAIYRIDRIICIRPVGDES